jgi:Trk-type K+ transport system membrane component
MDDADAPEQQGALITIFRQVLHPLVTLAAAVGFLAIVGWTGRVTPWIHAMTLGIALAFAVERTGLFLNLRARRGEHQRLFFHEIIAAMVGILALVLLLRGVPAQGPGSVAPYVGIQLGILVSGLASAIHHQARFTARAFHPGWMLMGSFLAIIIGGTLLLKMPRCVQPGLTCSWLDAAFTSTSAVCVTGLAVQNTATFFSHTGQVVILLLIQIGGLGIMTLTFFAAVVLSEGLSLHDRLLLGRMIQDNRLSRISSTLTFIVVFTLVCEAVGAAVLFLGMDGGMGWRERLFHSVFHSVSAFCNAGFSTLPDGMASAPVVGNSTWQVAVMLLIVFGGLGAIVVEDLSHWCVSIFRRMLGRESPRHRLRIHTRIVVFSTAILIFGGGAAILVTEFLFWDGPENGGKVLTSLFHSVTARTAGFNTVPMGLIGPLTVQVLMILMLIGGSPGGTAGGIRTTVVTVGLGHLWSQLRSDKHGMVVFNRTIPAEAGSRALGLMVMAGIWLVASFMIFQYIEAGREISGTRLLFELISAFATVGLSLDLTPSLTDGGKTLLIVNMFVGRIGLLTVMATLIPQDKRPVSGKPSEGILLT